MRIQRANQLSYVFCEGRLERDVLSGPWMPEAERGGMERLPWKIHKRASGWFGNMLCCGWAAPQIYWVAYNRMADPAQMNPNLVCAPGGQPACEQ